MVQSNELLVNYGAFPADPALQQTFFDTTQKNYPDSKIDWTVPAGDARVRRTSPTTRPGCPTIRSRGPPSRPSRTSIEPLKGSTSMPSSQTVKTTLQGIFDEYYAAN